MTRNKLHLAAVAIALCVAQTAVYGASGGADSGYSGAPGEQNCAFCHSSSSGFGSVQIAFVNGSFYTPGAKQHLVLTITDAPEQAWGFQLTARTGSNNQAGNFIPGGEGFTRTVCADTALKKQSLDIACTSALPLQYIQHTLAGARIGQKRSAQFEFDWTPPSSDVGAITFYMSAVAADGTSSGAGNHVYNQRYTLTVPLPNQPQLSKGGTVNAANFDSAVSPGSWVTVQGTNLANSTRPWGAADFVSNRLPTTLDGVSVMIDGKPAYVSYVSPTQLNVLAPSNPSLGIVNVVVTNNGLLSNPSTVTVQTAAPALFAWSAKYAVATRPDFSLVAPVALFPNVTTKPAQPGDIVILWATGLGPASPSPAVGVFTPSDQLYSVLNLPTVLIGGISAQVIGAALAPGYAGLYQIAVKIPDGLANGDQPIRIQSGSAQSPAGLLLTIQQ